MEVGKTQCSGTGCTNGNYLLRTQDGGTTVQEANIPFDTSEVSIFPQPAPQTPQVTNQSSQEAGPLALMTGDGLHGFDTYSAPSNALLAAWSQTYPFSDAIGIYIGGENRHDKVQENLNPEWIQKANCYLWDLLPIWVGQQSPGVITCPTCSTFSLDPAQAQARGVAEAQGAIAAMLALGIVPPGIVYYDLENYGTPYTRADNAFVEGWVTTLHAAGFSAGVYGSPYNALDWAVQDEPDDVWLTKQNGGTSTFGISPLPDSDWANHQRIVQFVTKTPESFLGYTLPTVDYNLIAGQANFLNGFGSCTCSDQCDPACYDYDPSEGACGPGDGDCFDCYSFPELSYCCSECNVCGGTY